MNRFFSLLLAVSCLTAVGQYEVGDAGPAGGWIFYVDSLDEFDWDYLEVASFSGQAPNWGGYFQCSDNIEQSFEVGRGEWNTAYCLGEASPSIIADLGTGSPGALVEAVGHTQGGYADWYLPSVGELELLYSAFGDSIADMIDISDYCSPGLRFWTSSFTVTDVYVNSCQRRGVTFTLGVGTSSQETTGNQWGSGCSKVHGVLPIRSFSKSIQDACGVGTVWDELTQTCIVDESACGWQPDGNGDNLIGVNDLLDLLGVYGDTDYDQDGIWDSADDCVGEYDECGVCNGSGPSIPIIESIEILYDSVYAEPIDEWLVFEVGTDTTYQYVCEMIEGCIDSGASNFDAEANFDDGSCLYQSCQGLNTLSYQGVTYDLVEMGGVCWFADNLQVSSYTNGDPIQADFNDSFWSTIEGACAIYGESGSSCEDFSPEIESCDPQTSLFEYGRLYNWYAVADERGICPSSWHVASDEDWMNLELSLGMNPSEVTENGQRGTDEAWALKSQYGWDNGNNGTDSLGFNVTPGGFRRYYGPFEAAGRHTSYWTSTDFNEEGAIYRSFYFTYGTIGRIDYYKDSGLHVRCVKDAE